MLELGCGKIKHVPHSVTLDINPTSVADVIHDLNVFPYPFDDNEFDVVIAEHVLEHLDNLIAVVEELHRVLKPGGTLYVEVPHFSCSDFFTDPTHKHAFSTRSFDYFVPDTVLHQYHYSKVAFKKKSVRIYFYENHRWQRIFGRWINRNTLVYERKLAFILPSQLINFELEVMK